MTILLTDKKVATILEPRHMLELVDEYMGTDARMWFEDYLAGADSQTADVAAMETYVYCVGGETHEEIPLANSGAYDHHALRSLLC